MSFMAGIMEPMFPTMLSKVRMPMRKSKMTKGLLFTGGGTQPVGAKVGCLLLGLKVFGSLVLVAHSI